MKELPNPEGIGCGLTVTSPRCVQAASVKRSSSSSQALNDGLPNVVPTQATSPRLSAASQIRLAEAFDVFVGTGEEHECMSTSLGSLRACNMIEISHTFRISTRPAYDMNM